MIRVSKTHSEVICYLFIFSIILFFIFLYLIYPIYGGFFSYIHYWSFYCHGFLICWWLIYFTSRPLKIWNLNLFLKRHSQLRCMPAFDRECNDFKELEKAIIAKSSSSTSALTIYIAIIALFMAIVMRQEPICEFQHLLHYFILVAAVIGIIFLIFAIDLLDTVANKFLGGPKTAYQYQLIFYNNLGPPLIKGGGLLYTYWGYAWFSLFLILSVSFFHPLLAGLGLSVFTYIGYPIMFGYRGKWEKNEFEVEIDKEVKWPSIVLGGLFFFITAFIWKYFDN